MYSTSGLVYRIMTIGLVMLLIGIVCLLLSKFWNSQSRKNLFLIIAVFLVVFAILYIGFFSFKVLNPSVSTCEGAFVREYADSSQAPFTRSYVFDIGTSKDIRLHLDSFSKKNIFPDEFIKDAVYKITFEKDTGIILHVEVISQNDN